MAKNSKRTQKKVAKEVVKAAKRDPKGFWIAVSCILLLLIVLGTVYFLFLREDDEAVETGELSIHFLDVGNRFAGDCVLVKAGNTELLIDAGSRQSSAQTIVSYVGKYCTDGILEYVVVTHADQDHIAGFVGTGGVSVFGSFACKTIIDFPRTNKSETTASGRSLYGKYVDARDAEVKETAGAVHYTALQCWNESDGASRSYEIAEGITFNILYQRYYEEKASDENNYSVSFLLSQGNSHYLFTGDLEAEGEKSLVENNTLPHCKLFKAGHHGSPTSSTEELLRVITPEVVCVCCCAGSTEYTHEPRNTFPSQAMIDRVGKYTKQIYVTNLDDDTAEEGYVNLNGNIVFSSNGVEFSVTGSKNSVILKETEWFKKNRTWPADGVK